MTKLHYLLSIGLLSGLCFGCGDNDPPPAENEEEIIDLVTLTFSDANGSSVFTAEDPDGPGPADLAATGTITLQAGKVYTLDIAVENVAEGEDITDEIKNESDEHQFFFSWTGQIFESPTGLGNIGSGNSPVNYQDKDDNGLDVGLKTVWETSGSAYMGTFRVLLKHQPGIKSSSTTSANGETDINITWDVEIE